jgi:hypothetical protein
MWARLSLARSNLPEQWNGCRHPAELWLVRFPVGVFFFVAAALVPDAFGALLALGAVARWDVARRVAFFEEAFMPGITDLLFSTTLPATSAAPPATSTMVLATAPTPLPTLFNILRGSMSNPSELVFQPRNARTRPPRGLVSGGQPPQHGLQHAAIAQVVEVDFAVQAGHDAEAALRARSIADLDGELLARA